MFGGEGGVLGVVFYFGEVDIFLSEFAADAFFYIFDLVEVIFPRRRVVGGRRIFYESDWE